MLLIESVALQIYAFGGSLGASGMVPKATYLEEFNPITRVASILTTNKAPTERSGASLMFYRPRNNPTRKALIVFGGQTVVGKDTIFHNDVNVLNIATLKWTTLSQSAPSSKLVRYYNWSTHHEDGTIEPKTMLMPLLISGKLSISVLPVCHRTWHQPAGQLFAQPEILIDSNHPLSDSLLTQYRLALVGFFSSLWWPSLIINHITKFFSPFCEPHFHDASGNDGKYHISDENDGY